MSPILNNLLRCPFCGGEAVIKKNKTVMVSCKKCTASAFQRLDDKDSAINNWNSRSHLSLSALGDEDWWELFDAMVPSTYLEGVNAVIRAGNKVPPYAETENYVPKVIDIYHRFRARQS